MESNSSKNLRTWEDDKKFISHFEATRIIAEKRGLHRKQVDKIIKLFFSKRWGIVKYLSRQYPVSIHDFGAFKLSSKGALIRRRTHKNSLMVNNDRAKRMMQKWKLKKVLIKAYDHLKDI